MNKKEAMNFPPAAERTLQILDHFIKDPSPKTLKTLSDELSIPPASLYRIIRCMEEYLYISEDPKFPNYFRLGYKLMQLSDISFAEKELINSSRPFMKMITQKTNQASQLCVLTESGICTIEQILPHSVITYISEIGRPLPINVTASGKLLTALLPGEKQKAFLKKAVKLFTTNTPYTITDPDKFQKELEKIASQKYSTDVEEYAIGIGCIAVPIYNSEDIPIAAIGVTGPIEFYQNTENFNSALESLYQASSEISLALN